MAAACRPGSLKGVGGAVTFSSPDDPGAVEQIDGGVVRIDFGPVVVGTTKTLTLQFASLGSDATLGQLTPVQPDPEFSLPLSQGTLIGPVPSEITVAFSPTALGPKSAVFQVDILAATSATTTFDLSGLSVTNGLVVTPSPLDFGRVEVAQSATLPLTIANQGQASITLEVSALDGSDGGVFALTTPRDSTLAPGASTILDATFSPEDAGSFKASFSLNGWTGNPVELSGTGLGPALVVSSPVDFGFVQPGTVFTRPLVVQNLSEHQTFNVTAFPLFSQALNSLFLLQYPVQTFPQPILPGQALLIPVSFAPTNLGFASETVFVSTDDPRAPVIPVQLQGWGGGPHLSCPSPLIFGPVAVGFSTLQQVVCVNAGADIPRHPQFTLDIAQADLGVDNPAYAATLLLPDGGAVDPDGGVALTAGEAATIQVRFRPSDAGQSEGRLSILTNDVDDADAGITLEGEGVVPGICDLQLRPVALGFDENPPGATGVLQFEIDDVGQDYCILTNVSIDPASDPAYSIASPNPPYTLLSFAGNTDNPLDLPTGVRADVQFAPTELEPLATGTADVTIVNAQPPDRSVPLTGVCLAGCLEIQPPDRSFGRAGFSEMNRQICEPETQPFTITNTCPASVTVTGLALSPGLDATAQFSLGGAPSTPFTLDAGDEVGFQVNYLPTGLGESVEAVDLTSSEFPQTPYLISLQADAEYASTRTDSFTVPIHHVDLAWFLDEDDDYAQIQNVKALLPALFAALNQAQVDYQMAITSTDTCALPNSVQGSFEPCDHCLTLALSSALFITPATPDPLGAMSALLDAFDLPPQLNACTAVNGDEHFFDSIAAAFSSSLRNGHNAGFLRPEAYLAIAVVNGDDEDDANDAAKGLGPYLYSEPQINLLLQSLKPDRSMASVSYINAGVDSLTEGYLIRKLATDTGGVEININQEVGKLAFLNLLTATEGLGVFRLSSPAIGSSPFQVEVDGVPVDGWSYDPMANAIDFAPGSIPPPGSTVSITYAFGCP